MSFDANVRLASGSGLVARRGDAVLVLPGGSERDGGLLSRFLEPTAENRIDAVTECAEDADEALPPFICISWERRLRVVVYGDAELVTDHPALPMMSGAGSGTWVERSLSKVSGAIRIDVCCAVEAALPWTDLGSGVVAAAGASIMLTPSVAGAEESERPTAVTGSEMVTPVAPVTQVPPPLVAPVRSPSEQVADERRAVNGQPAVARHNDFLDDVFAEPIAPSGPAVPPARSTADLLVDDLLGSSSPTPRPPDPPSPSPAPVPPTPTPTPTPLDEELTFVPAAKPDVAEMVRHHATETGAPGRPTIEASGVPTTAVEAIRAAAQAPDVLVVKAGYNEGSSAFRDSVVAVLSAARGRGVRAVVWLTYSEGTRGQLRTYELNNAVLRELRDSGAWPELVIADWRTYAASSSGWYSDDRVHLQGTGAWATSDYIARWVAHVTHRPCPQPWAPGEALDDRCPSPDAVAAARGTPALRALYGF